MTGRVQTLRSNVTGSRPTGRQPGELYVNWADGQIGVINSTSGAQDFVGVRFFSTTANYNIGDFVVQGGQLYRAVAASNGGAFLPANWAQIGGSVGIGATAPGNPQPGTLWWDANGGQLYVWYNDGDSSQWVIANNLGPTVTAAAVITIGDTPPVNPVIGALWFDSAGSQLYVWFGDGTSNQWVPTTNQMGGGYLLKAGVVDGSDAPGGQIGEIISVNVTVGVTLTTSTPANLTSITLTPGDWDVQGEVWFNIGTGAATTLVAAISPSSAFLPTPTALNQARNQINVPGTPSTSIILPLRTCRISLAVTATYYLVAYAVFPSGTTTVTGNIWARRAR
jgi:hypothetical protein